MLYVHLSNDEKLLALVLALALFLVSLFLSVCLVYSCCPLNRWLARRAQAKKQRRHSLTAPGGSVLAGVQQLHQNLHHYHHGHLLHKHPPGTAQRHGRPVFVVDKQPPPAYDSVCSKAPIQMGRNPFMSDLAPLDNGNGPCSTPAGSSEKQQLQQLHFGDYFHQPCEPAASVHEPHVAIPIPASISSHPLALGPADRHQPTAAKPPIMLRLWAQLMEPDKLERLMEGSQEEQPRPALSRLSRQLSIPQLFGSIVSLTGAGSPVSQPAPNGATPADNNTAPSDPPTTTTCSTQTPPGHAAAPKPLASRVLHSNVASFSYLSDLELSADRKRLEASSQTCQLLVGICDVENLLNTSWQLERSCAHLTSSSAIYAQCELLASRPSRTRLLRHPLRALQAAAGCPMAEKWAVYEPTTDGRCVLVFTSQPRQVELALAGSAASEHHLGQTDVISFNSVFVGPPMSKKALEGARLSVRLYSRSRYLNETCLAELNIPLKRLLGIVEPQAGLPSSTNSQDNNLSSTALNNQSGAPAVGSEGPLQAGADESALKQLITHLLPTNRPPSNCGSATSQHTNNTASKHQLAAYTKGADEPASQLRNSCSADAALCQLATCALSSEQQQQQQQPEWAAQEQLYWRSLMAAHWLNQMPNSVHECQPVRQQRANLVLGLSYLPTSNRVIFNAHRAQIVDSGAPSQSLVKELRIHTGTCYLLRFLMVVGGRVIRRKQTPAASRPEWDGQEPITFDLASVGVATPVFLVLLVLCQPAGGSGRKARRACAGHSTPKPGYLASDESHYGAGAQSEPETSGSGPSSTCAVCRQGRSSRFELVLGHTTLASETWRELRSQPRRQLVSQLDMY